MATPTPTPATATPAAATVDPAVQAKKAKQDKQDALTKWMDKLKEQLSKAQVRTQKSALSDWEVTDLESMLANFEFNLNRIVPPTPADLAVAPLGDKDRIARLEARLGIPPAPVQPTV